MGHIAGFYGVKGWVKVHSYTDPRDGILDYKPLFIETSGAWCELKVEEGRGHGKTILLKIRDINDRNHAASLIKHKLAVKRQQLPALDDSEVYWADLEGLDVINLEDIRLGQIDRLMQTGANDVMVIRGERERLIPFLRDQVVQKIDLENQRMTVDWDAEF